jgi:hypothetical protein
MTWLVIIGAIALLTWLMRRVFWGIHVPTLQQRYPGCPEYLLEQCDAFHRAQQQATQRALKQIADDARDPNPRWLQQRMRELRGER